MIKVQDWIASIPEEEKHVAYVGEGMSEQREFLLCGDGWENYEDWSFHLDMAFDPESITTRDSRQVVQTTVNSAEHKEETGVTKDEVTTKETYTVHDEEVLSYDLTDVAPLDKWVEEEGIRLTWTVLRQHTLLPGKLWATIRAVSADAKRIKKSAMMVFEVEPSVSATPAAMPPVSEFEQMEAQMDALRQKTVEAAEEAAGHAENAADAAINAEQARADAAREAESAMRSSVTAVSAASGSAYAQQLAAESADEAAEHAKQAESHRGYAAAEANTAVEACTEAKEQAQIAAEQAAAAETARQNAAGAVTKASAYAMQAETSAATATEAAAKLTEAVEDVDDLTAAVFGDSKPYLFNSETDEFGDGGFGLKGLPYADGYHHIPRFNIADEPVTVRIYSYNSNGMEADRTTHSLWTCQYDADGNFISGTRQTLKFYAVTEDGTVGGEDTYYGDLLRIEKAYANSSCTAWRGGGICTITPVDGAKYAAIWSIYDGVDIDIKLWAGDEPIPSGLAHEVSELDKKVGELDEAIRTFEPEKNYNIVDGNEALVGTVFGKTSGSNYLTDFSVVVIADMHGKFVSLDDAANLRDTLVPNAVILNAGDIINLKAKMNGEMNPEAAAYMEKAIQHCVYHTMGQHECGWNSTSMAGGRLKANCMTHKEVFDTFIAPMREVWDLPDLDTIYYYKDFPNTSTGKGTRLISLYQYNVPLVEDETDTACYKYDRNTVWLGQEQLDWLINTLATTPDGYRVIILQHQLERDVEDAKEGSAFHDGVAPYLYVTSFAGAPVKDIVQAYIDKTTLTKTYTAGTVDGITYPDDLFTVTVNADFTNATGEFGHYISGDAHIDFVGYVRGTKQRHIVLTSCNQNYDCYLSPAANNASRSIVNLMGYDYKRGFVRLGRVGQQYSMAGQTRVLERVSLTSKEG